MIPDLVREMRIEETFLKLLKIKMYKYCTNAVRRHG